MKTRSVLFDSECYDLACHFLQDERKSTAEDADELAAHIQQAIEDWLTKFEEPATP